MDLYLLRHAIAEESTGLKPDSHRRLTPDGARKMRQIAKGMKSLDLNFDLILSSHYLRAKETAEIVAKTFRLGQALKLSPSLVPDGNPKELIEELTHLPRRDKRILLVGHEPYLGKLTSLLLSGHTHIAVNFKKAGLCHLTVSGLHYGRCATLEWLLTPTQMRALD